MRYIISFGDLSLVFFFLFPKSRNKPNEAYNEIGYRIESVYERKNRKFKCLTLNGAHMNTNSCFDSALLFRTLSRRRRQRQQRWRHIRRVRSRGTVSLYIIRWYNLDNYVFFFSGQYDSRISTNNQIHSMVTVMPILTLYSCIQYHLLWSNNRVHHKITHHQCSLGFCTSRSI